jgi:multiple antibiotic resistance protein
MNIVFDFVEILKVTTVLFAVIDIIGSIPVIINLKQAAGSIDSFFICRSKYFRYYWY